MKTSFDSDLRLCDTPSPRNRVTHADLQFVPPLSEFFGCEVTHRRGKVLKLTPEGASLAELVRPLLRGLEDFHSECRNERTVFNIAAGDSLIHWLVIPRLGGLLKTLPDVRFSISSLRTNEIVRQIFDGRVDFGLIRKNAVTPGLKSIPLGTLSYVAVVPTQLASRKPVPKLSEVFKEYPLAMQNTDGQFAKQLRDIAISEDVSFRPGLGCESFPQTLAAVRSGRFAAIIPELAVKELPAGTVHKIIGEPLRHLKREVVLVWSPRVIKVRIHAAKVVAAMQAALRFS